MASGHPIVVNNIFKLMLKNTKIQIIILYQVPANTKILDNERTNSSAKVAKGILLRLYATKF